MHRIKEIILHYTATYEDDKTVTTKIIDGWHKARGWKGIGYHFVIYQDGTLHIGRPLSEVGAHAPPNTGRAGVCYVGGLKRGSGANAGFDTRTPEQIATMTKLLKDMLSGKYNSSSVYVEPLAPVLGHRDVGNTQCPGFDARAWWRAVSVGGAAPAPTPPINAPVRTSEVREDRPPVRPTDAAAATVATGAVAGGGIAFGWLGALAVLALVAVAGYFYFKWRK